MNNLVSTIRNTSVRPSEVRKWARENGYEVGERGRFDQTVVDAYNRVHKGSRRYVQAGYKVARTLSVRADGKNRKISVPAARAVLRAAGEPVGRRGRMTKAQILRALELAAQQD